MLRFFAIFIFSVCIKSILAQGVLGHITDENGEPLPYAAIYVKEAGVGTAANIEGYYELQLPAGKYGITFQFMGYQTQTVSVSVAKNFKKLDIKMEPETVTLQTVTVSDDAEDPAYTVMRRAIAKAKYHLLQTDSYSAEVYTKGTADIKKMPALMRKMIERDGVDLDRVFTSESVSEIYFERPNTFKEKIISVRTSGEDDNNANPNAYINSSFYLPIVNGAVSPLSPNAFAYYKFELLGTYEDRGYIINKIKIIPRSKGENVFSGTIYIREDFWNIHKLQVRTIAQMGVEVEVEQVFGPIVDEIWMPVSQNFTLFGKLFGTAVEYKYLASVSNYQVVPNTELNPNIMVLDTKIADVPEDVEMSKQERKDSANHVLKKKQTFSQKDLAKLMESYEDEQKKAREKNIIADTWFELDSNATKKDSSYWAQRRPVPLTDAEKDGYRKDDSAYVAAKQDSLEKVDGSAFRASDIIFGGRYSLGPRLRYNFDGFLTQFQFNTVEGFNLTAANQFWWKNDTALRLRLSPTVRYGFSGSKLYGKLKAESTIGKKRGYFLNLSAEGGKYISQFNPDAINPLVNTFWSLFLARNYMKVYDQTYATISLKKQLGFPYFVAFSATAAERSQLYNRTDYSFFKPGNNQYTSNEAINQEIATVPFKNSGALKTSVIFSAKPWLKYVRRNGILFPVDGSSPEFSLTYNAGWDGIFSSQTDFHQLELDVVAEFDLGVRATFDFHAQVGTFLSNSQMLFMDFKHFNGGLTEIAPMAVTGNYRLLDYYQYSTQSSYFSWFSHIRFRKFLLTQIPIVRMAGIKENLFFNYLKTETSPHYWEAGYTIDYILRVLRIEFVHSFTEFQPHQFGIRIGVASFNFSN